MSIIATRIDGRLIHGQVSNLWTKKLNIGRIMVIDDAV
ncbi:PTS sugar transporter subunit IIB, partial [Streptococcus suis]